MFTHWKRYACAYVSGVAEGLAAIGDAIGAAIGFIVVLLIRFYRRKLLNLKLRPRKPKTTDENQG